jgi:pimeloyl-CoA synthetase
MAMQVNYLMDKGAFVPHGDGTFSVNMEKVKDAVRDLDHDLLTIEAQGDYAGAKKMLDELGVIRPVLRRALERLHDIPTDIEPIFVTADEIAPSASAPPVQVKAPVRKKARKKR